MVEGGPQAYRIVEEADLGVGSLVGVQGESPCVEIAAQTLVVGQLEVVVGL